MVSFTRFVISYAEEANKFGDLARDVAADEAVNVRWSYKQLKDHIEKMQPLPVVLELLKELHFIHRTSISEHPRNIL
jgi:hypothetical protein